MDEISTVLHVAIDIWDRSSDGFREELGSRLRRVADRIAEFSIKATSYIHPWLMEVTLFVLQHLQRDVLAVSAADCIEALKGTAFGEKEIECLVVAKHTSEAVAKAMTNLNSLRNSVVGSHLAGIQADIQQVQNVADGLVAFCDVTVCLNKCITANDSNDATSLELLGKLDGAVSELKKSPGTGRSSANLRQFFSHISAALLAGPEQYLHMKIHATHPKVEKEFKEKLLLNSFPADHDQFDLPLDSVDALKKHQAFPANTSAKVEQFVKLCESAFGDHWRAQLAQCHAKMDLAQRALVVYKLKRLELPDASLLACNDKLDFEDEFFDASLDVKAKMESFIEICKLVKNDFSNASAASLSKKTTAKMSLKGAGKGPKPGSGTQVAAEKNEKGEGDGSGKEVAEDKEKKSEDKKGDGDGSGKEVAEEKEKKSEDKKGDGDGSGKQVAAEKNEKGEGDAQDDKTKDHKETNAEVNTTGMSEASPHDEGEKAEAGAATTEQVAQAGAATAEQVQEDANEKGDGDGSGRKVAEGKEENDEDEKGDGDSSGKALAAEKNEKGEGGGSVVAEEPPKVVQVKATGVEPSKDKGDAQDDTTTKDNEKQADAEVNPMSEERVLNQQGNGVAEADAATAEQVQEDKNEKGDGAGSGEEVTEEQEEKHEDKKGDGDDSGKEVAEEKEKKSEDKKGDGDGSEKQVAAEKNEKGEGDGSGKEVAEEKYEKSEDKKGDGDGSGKEVAEEEGKNGKGDGSGVAEEPPEDAEVKATGAEESKEAKDGDGKDTSDAHEIVEDDVVEFTFASHLDNALELCPMMLNHLLNHWTNTCKAICSITSPLHPPREEWEVFALRAVNGDKIKGYASDEKFLSIGKWGKKCDSYLAHTRKKCQEASDLQLRNWWDMAGVKGSHKKACNHVKEAKLALAVIHTANKIHVKKKITEKEKKTEMKKRTRKLIKDAGVMEVRRTTTTAAAAAATYFIPTVLTNYNCY